MILSILGALGILACLVFAARAIVIAASRQEQRTLNEAFTRELKREQERSER